MVPALLLWFDDRCVHVERPVVHSRREVKGIDPAPTNIQTFEEMAIGKDNVAESFRGLVVQYFNIKDKGNFGQKAFYAFGISYSFGYVSPQYCQAFYLIGTTSPGPYLVKIGGIGVTGTGGMNEEVYKRYSLWLFWPYWRPRVMDKPPPRGKHAIHACVWLIPRMGGFRVAQSPGWPADCSSGHI